MIQVLIRAVGLAFVLGVAAIVLAVFNAHPTGAAGSAPVTVTNTPLPVQGIVAASLSGPWSVGVNGTPNVNIANAAVPIQGTVNLGNTPNVNIANSPAVTVGNTAASPVLVRDTEQPARAPFQVGANAAIGCGPTVVFSVPSGKEAVIEYLSFSGEGFTSGTPPMAAGTGVAIWTQTANSVTPGSISHDIPVLLHGNSQLFGSPYSHFVATQQLRLYADPETDIKLSGCQNGTGFLATIFSISGYLVNVP